VNGPADWEKEEERLASASLAADDPTGWFDQLYAAGASGQVQMPWGRIEPHALLTGWVQDRNLTGGGRRAVVVGCGLGARAQYLASLGFDTIGFDISETAIRLASQRFPASKVCYITADVLDLPARWVHGFDVVVEIITVQAMPDPPRRQAITDLGRLVPRRDTISHCRRR
jgi:SAM-dependent methyltransferase